MCLCYHDYNHYHYYYYYHHYCCRSCCCYQYYYHHHLVIIIITIIIIILGIFNHQCMWTYYYKIGWDFAMMRQIAAFKYILNWYIHPGIYSSMEYSITWRHKLCRAFTIDALASRPVACKVMWWLYPTWNTCEVFETHLKIGTRRWKLWQPDLQMSCNDLTERYGTSIVVSIMAARATIIINKNRTLVTIMYTNVYATFGIALYQWVANEKNVLSVEPYFIEKNSVLLLHDAICPFFYMDHLRKWNGYLYYILE